MPKLTLISSSGGGGGGSTTTTIVPITNGVGSPYVIAANQSGFVFTNEGATVLTSANLPAAAAGLYYLFYVQDADGLRVNASAGDTIRLYSDVTAVAGHIDSTDIGSFVTLYAVNSTEWVSSSANGIWTPT